MSAHTQARLTEEQYLEIERAAEFKSEFYDGRMYAMSGGSYVHFQIIGNLTGELHHVLKSSPCSVGPSDLRLKIPLSGLSTYPDVMVICGEPRFADTRHDTLLNPTFLAEVLSPSTERYDRVFKSSQYRMLEGLREFALLSQDQPRVELYRRQTNGEWPLFEAVGLDGVCMIENLGCRLLLRDLYAKVKFPD